MINSKVLLLTISDQRLDSLNKYPGVDLHCNYDLKNWEAGFGNIFSKLLIYDYFKNYVDKGIRISNDEIISIVKNEKPEYLIWPSMTFEILESTFIEIRKNECKIIGCFFDDSFRFESFTKYYIPYLDYIITFESKNALKKYLATGVNAVFIPNFPSCNYFYKKQIPYRYDISFVGAKTIDRKNFIDNILNEGINVKTFGSGWEQGYVSTEEMINIYNSTKINLNFIKSIDEKKTSQLKGRIFEICMCGGFLLTEYIEELEEYFEINKEIVCFNSIKDVISKINYYLTNEELRLKIAEAGYNKVKNIYNLEKTWQKIFLNIENNSIKSNLVRNIKVSNESNLSRAAWHINMAYALFLEKKNNIYKDELNLAKKYNSCNIQVIVLNNCQKLPYFLSRFIILNLIKTICLLNDFIKNIIKKDIINIVLVNAFIKKFVSFVFVKIKSKIIIIGKRMENLGSIFQILKQLKEFKNAPDFMLSSKVEAKTNISNIIERFNNLSIPVDNIEIDIEDFIKWKDEYNEISKFYENMNDAKIEKILEHYLTMKYLNISKEDILIDIAAASGPFADIVQKHLKTVTYKQDLGYKPGIVRNMIGSNASQIPVPDNFADVLTLHCAYECFQEKDDILFIKEATRILKKNGRLGIVPLYIDDIYFVKTGPKYDKRKIKIEKDTRWIWRDDEYLAESFSRHYSPESFRYRIIDNIKNMKYKILHFMNIKSLQNYFIGQRIYCNFLFKAIKE